MKVLAGETPSIFMAVFVAPLCPPSASDNLLVKLAPAPPANPPNNPPTK